MYLFDSHCEVQDLVVLEVLQGVLFDDRYAHIRVAEGLDAVPDAHYQFVLLAHALHVVRSVGTFVGPLYGEHILRIKGHQLPRIGHMCKNSQRLYVYRASPVWMGRATELAWVNISAALSSAPPNRGPMVSSPEQRADTRSLPALAVTMVL